MVSSADSGSSTASDGQLGDVYSTIGAASEQGITAQVIQTWQSCTGTTGTVVVTQANLFAYAKLYS